MSNDRDEMVPQLYLAFVEGVRPDLTGLFPLIDPGDEWRNTGRVLDRALETGRPVRLVKPMPGLEVKAAMVPQPGGRAGGLGPTVAVDAHAADPALRDANVVFSDRDSPCGVLPYAPAARCRRAYDRHTVLEPACAAG